MQGRRTPPIFQREASLREAAEAGRRAAEVARSNASARESANKTGQDSGTGSFPDFAVVAKMHSTVNIQFNAVYIINGRF